MRVGFAGAGNIAAAIARGWGGAGDGPEAMLFCDAGSGRARALAAETGGEARTDLAELGRDSDLVVLATKPAALEAASEGLGGAAGAILSVLGATPMERLREAFPGAGLLRAMPNVAVEVRRGVICHAPPEGMSEELAGEAIRLLGVLGAAVELDERLLDPATAVMGCSPAYLALVVEGLVDAGVREGLDAETAGRLVVEALAGTAELLRDRDTLSVRRSVTSPGGSTAAGLAELERGSVRADLVAAVRASVERMRA